MFIKGAQRCDALHLWLLVQLTFQSALASSRPSQHAQSLDKLNEICQESESNRNAAFCC